MKCPICKKEVDESLAGKPGGVLPFCSDRCKLIDLGRWLNGSYQIEVDASDDESQDEGTPETIHPQTPLRRGRPPR